MGKIWCLSFVFLLCSVFYCHYYYLLAVRILAMKYLYNETTDFIYKCCQNTENFARNDKNIYVIAKLTVNECKAPGALVDIASAIYKHTRSKQK